MTANDDGGRAFPFAHETLHPEEHAINGGMTLRDYFAAKAMTAMVTAEFVGSVTPDYWAKEAYKVADAMIKERAK